MLCSSFLHKQRLHLSSFHFCRNTSVLVRRSIKSISCVEQKMFSLKCNAMCAPCSPDDSSTHLPSSCAHSAHSCDHSRGPSLVLSRARAAQPCSHHILKLKNLRQNYCQVRTQFLLFSNNLLTAYIISSPFASSSSFLNQPQPPNTIRFLIRHSVQLPCRRAQHQHLTQHHPLHRRSSIHQSRCLELPTRPMLPTTASLHVRSISSSRP